VTNGGMVVGDGALVSVGAGGYLRVTNNFVNTAGASTVKFVASQTAVGRIKVDGIWSNSATALLNVNLTGYTGGWPVTLATFSSASPATPYAAENITVTGGGGGVTIKQTATQIQVAKVTGAVILVR
jgi:hypothetical protein